MPSTGLATKSVSSTVLVAKSMPVIGLAVLLYLELAAKSVLGTGLDAKSVFSTGNQLRLCLAQG